MPIFENGIWDYFIFQIERLTNYKEKELLEEYDADFVIKKYVLCRNQEHINNQLLEARAFNYSMKDKPMKYKIIPVDIQHKIEPIKKMTIEEARAFIWNRAKVHDISKLKEQLSS